MADTYGKKMVVNVKARTASMMDLTAQDKTDYDKTQFNSKQLAARLADPLWPNANQLLAAQTLALAGNLTLLNQLNANIALVVAKYPLST